MGDAVKRIYAIDKPVVDIMLIDLKLPNGHGKEVVRKFQGLFPQIPSVIITGLDISSTELIQEGAHDVIRKKNMHSEDIPRTIYRAIARHQVRADYKPIRDELAGMIRDAKADSSKCCKK